MALRIARSTRTWLRDHWSILAILLGIFLLALFLRTYFAFDLATSNGFVLSGGSDSYYHKRIIDAVVQTGKHVYEEPLLNYPTGIQASGRPPLYDWSVAVTGMVLAPLFESVDVAVWYVFLFSTAFWGALTIFPLYFLTKEAFGRRAGLIAAFFLAVMPAHIQRSPFTNGDHDAYLLFFVVAAFFFFLKALRSLEETKWVKSWRKPEDIRAGLRKFYAGNQTAFLYSLMSALSITAIALAWKGFAYVIVILLLYLLIELLINRFRNVDSMGVLAVFAITVGVALLLSFPWYASYGFIQTWFDVPVYLYVAALGFGLIFVVTRNYPWTLVLPVVFALFGGGFLVASFFFPGLTDAFVSGAGYFVRTKAYETIAEAQAPNFSQVALALGAVTYYLSLAGLLWAAVQIPKRPQADYLFVVVWSGAAIFMALGAARFLFNGAPAFAVTSAWVVSILVDKLDFKAVRRTFQGLRGNKLTALRKSVKIRHVVGALFLAFIVVMPTVWYGVDASIPIQRKKDFDLQVYYATPEFLRPANYPVEGQQSFYFGAFGYSLPLKRQYYPAAWSWLRSQDSGIYPLEERPAYLSWWDYGFEAVNEGRHPTVADNFLDGYQLAGNFIMAQSEAEAIAYLSARILEGNMAASGAARDLSPEVRAVLEDHSVDVNLIVDNLRFPALFIDDIIQNPSRYGPRDSRMDTFNAMFIALKTHLTEALPTADEQADLYRDLRAATGDSIRYFAIDTRLFPFSGTNTGIFYAPAKLSDHRIRETPTGGSIPYDFYEITVPTDQGNFPAGEVPRGARQTDNARIDYQSMFFKTMLYRAFVGYGPEDLGRPITDGVPGISGSLQSEQPLLGWNLSHFRLAYRTAYYNPYPPEVVANHSEAWRAMNFLDAWDLQQSIQSGNAQGVVDLSYGSFAGSGVVFLKYYDGAIVRGTVTVDGVTPLPGARITVQDELAVPHYTTETDEQGRYEVLAPFGDVVITVSMGEMDLKTKVGASALESTTLAITDAQAMREPFDTDGDGILDYMIQQDFVVEGGSVKGDLFLDSDGDGQKDEGEAGLRGTLTFTHEEVGTTFEGATASDGRFTIDGLFPGTYTVTATSRERELGPFSAEVQAGDETESSFAVPTGTLQVNVTGPDEAPVPGAQVTLEDLVDGTVYSGVADELGQVNFTSLLEGAHALIAETATMTSGRVGLSITATGNNTAVARMSPAATITGRTRIGGSAAGYVTLTAVKDSSDPYQRVVTSDASGFFSLVVPEGAYDLYSSHTVGGVTYAALREIYAEGGDTVTADLNLQRAVWVHGRTLNEDDIERAATVTFTRGSASVKTVSSGIAEYRLYLPPGNYAIAAVGDAVALQTGGSFTEDTELDLLLKPSTQARGTVGRDLNFDGSFQTSEAVADALVTFTNEDGWVASTRAAASGVYAVSLVTNETYTLSVEAPGYASFVGETKRAQDWAPAGDTMLVADPVTVSGTLTFSDEVADVVVDFVPEGNGAEAASVVSEDGAYQIQLVPGTYSISILHNLTESGDSRYENVGGESFEVNVGEGAATLDFQVLKRHLVRGNVTLDGVPQDATVEFTGTEAVSVDTKDGEFSTYLAEGPYSVRAEVEVDQEDYAFLGAIAVDSPTNVTVTLKNAISVSGRLNTPTGPLEEVVNLTFFSQQGGSLEVLTDETGEYEVLLTSGDYLVGVDHPTTEPVKDGVRYIRYVATTDVRIPPSKQDISLTRVLDNITLTGRVTRLGVGVDAILSFTATSPSGVNLTATSEGDGTYEISIAPGDYDLSVHRTVGHSVFLGNVTFEPHADDTLDIELVEGLKLSGVLEYDDGAPTPGTVTFTSSATVEVEAGADGSYEAYLPSDIYQVVAEAEMVVGGRTDTYTATDVVPLSVDTVLNLHLEKVVHYGVDLEWIEGVGSTVAGGESVVYHVAVTNDGNVPDSYKLSGVPPREGWVFTFSKDTVELPEGSPSEVVEVTITAPEDALVDHGPISVRATSAGDPTVSAIESLEVNVTRVAGIDLALSDEPPRYEKALLYQGLKITNTGNAAETFTLTILNEDEMTGSGWEAVLVAENGTVHGTTASGIQVGANSTASLVLRFKNSGIAGTAEAILLGFMESDRSVERVFSVTAISPSVDVSSDNLNIQGEGITLVLAEDLATLAALPISVAIIAVLSLVYIWRKKRRWGR